MFKLPLLANPKPNTKHLRACSLQICPQVSMNQSIRRWCNRPSVIASAYALILILTVVRESSSLGIRSSAIVLSSPRRISAVQQCTERSLENLASSITSMAANNPARGLATILQTEPKMIVSRLVTAKENMFEGVVESVNAFVGGAIVGGFVGAVSGMGECIQGKSAESLLKTITAKGRARGSEWGLVSGCFIGFRSLVKVVRGGREDMWNNVIGSCGTGAFICRNEGLSGIARGCATYMLLTYCIENLSHRSKPKSEDAGKCVKKLMQTASKNTRKRGK